MMNNTPWDPQWDTLIDLALLEDVGTGDATTLALVPKDTLATATVVAREDGVLAGIALAVSIFRRLDHEIRLDRVREDATLVRKGDVVLRVSGSARALLTAERTVLNFLQRLSGIATLTAAYVALAKPYGVKILDTRKTTPGWRTLEKYAVTCGGGINHRMGLYDRIMIKDNHLAYWTASKEQVPLLDAIRAARAAYPDLLVEVEVDHLEQLKRIMESPPDWVLLDNMSPEQVTQCVREVDGRSKVEVSGGINLSTVAAYAAAKPDAISVGALTHSAKALDLSLDWSDE